MLDGHLTLSQPLLLSTQTSPLRACWPTAPVLQCSSGRCSASRLQTIMESLPSHKKLSPIPSDGVSPLLEVLALKFLVSSSHRHRLRILKLLHHDLEAPPHLFRALGVLMSKTSKSQMPAWMPHHIRSWLQVAAVLHGHNSSSLTVFSLPAPSADVLEFLSQKSNDQSHKSDRLLGKSQTRLLPRFMQSVTVWAQSAAESLQKQAFKGRSDAAKLRATALRITEGAKQAGLLGEAFQSHTNPQKFCHSARKSVHVSAFQAICNQDSVPKQCMPRHRNGGRISHGGRWAGEGIRCDSLQCGQKTHACRVGDEGEPSSTQPLSRCVGSTCKSCKFPAKVVHDVHSCSSICEHQESKCLKRKSCTPKCRHEKTGCITKLQCTMSPSSPITSNTLPVLLGLEIKGADGTAGLPSQEKQGFSGEDKKRWQHVGRILRQVTS